MWSSHRSGVSHDHTFSQGSRSSRSLEWKKGGPESDTGVLHPEKGEMAGWQTLWVFLTERKRIPTAWAVEKDPSLGLL